MNLNDKRFKAYSNASNSSAEDKKNAPNILKNSMSNKNVQENVNAKVQNQNDALLKVPRKEIDKHDSVYRRVAKFLMIIGVDQAAKVLQHLKPDQIEKIVPELATIRSISPEEKEVILAEFEGLANNASEMGGKQTAFTILEKAYGADKAEEMIKKASPYAGKKPFDYLNDFDSDRILYLLKDESAGIQALVLSNIEPKKAADVINKLSDEAKNQVVLHLANLGSVNPELLKRVDNAMYEKAMQSVPEKSDKVDGRNALAEILKKMSPKAEEGILSTLSEEDPELGSDLKERLFTLDDVLNAEDRFIQEYLQGKSNLEVVYLIAGKNEDYREKILKNVSKGRRNQILFEEDAAKPILAKDCDEETGKFLQTLRNAYEKGRLIIKGRNDKDFV